MNNNIKKISELPEISVFNETAMVPILQDGVTSRILASNFQGAVPVKIVQETGSSTSFVMSQSAVTRELNKKVINHSTDPSTNVLLKAANGIVVTPDNSSSRLEVGTDGSVYIESDISTNISSDNNVSISGTKLTIFADQFVHNGKDVANVTDINAANLTGILPITKGGTGATTKEDAAANLGVVPVNTQSGSISTYLYNEDGRIEIETIDSSSNQEYALSLFTEPEEGTFTNRMYVLEDSPGETKVNTVAYLSDMPKDYVQNSNSTPGAVLIYANKDIELNAPSPTSNININSGKDVTIEANTGNMNIAADRITINSGEALSIAAANGLDIEVESGVLLDMNYGNIGATGSGDQHLRLYSTNTNANGQRAYIDLLDENITLYKVYDMGGSNQQNTQIFMDNEGLFLSAYEKSGASSWNSRVVVNPHNVSLLGYSGITLQSGRGTTLKTISLPYSASDDLSIKSNKSVVLETSNGFAYVKSTATGTQKRILLDGDVSSVAGPSTTEVDTGMNWVDGRRLYQRSFSISNIPSSDSFELDITGTTANSIVLIDNTMSHFIESVNNHQMHLVPNLVLDPLDRGNYDPNLIFYVISRGAPAQMLLMNNSSAGPVSGVITIKYTKS